MLDTWTIQDKYPKEPSGQTVLVVDFDVKGALPAALDEHYVKLVTMVEQKAREAAAMCTVPVPPKPPVSDVARRLNQQLTKTTVSGNRGSWKCQQPGQYCSKQIKNKKAI